MTNADTDRVVWRAFEASATVRLIERAARRFRAAAETSVLLNGARSWFSGMHARAGHMIVAAALTHVVLMAAFARPVSWQWVTLPAIFTAIGLVLIVSRRRTEL